MLCQFGPIAMASSLLLGVKPQVLYHYYTVSRLVLDYLLNTGADSLVSEDDICIQEFSEVGGDRQEGECFVRSTIGPAQVTG